MSKQQHDHFSFPLIIFIEVLTQKEIYTGSWIKLYKLDGSGLLSGDIIYKATRNNYVASFILFALIDVNNLYRYPLFCSER